MFVPTNSPPSDWTSDDRKLLQTFLTSDTGRLALEWVAYFSPVLLDGADNGKTLVASGEVKGYTRAISELISLTREQPSEVKPPQNYPSLDDESAWSS